MVKGKKEAKGKKPKRKRVKTQKSSYYKVEDGKINRAKKACPKCGGGTFLAQHKNRFACGKCGYTEWNKGGN